jgi:hypothetical protein
MHRWRCDSRLIGLAPGADPTIKIFNYLGMKLQRYLGVKLPTQVEALL